jgi:AcrR family transcriptional regulator
MAITTSAPRRARDVARAELTRDILETAGRHLAEHGAAALSLRAVARDLEMASSAVYRYFPSRDALLTALIVAAYDELGDAVERSEARVTRSDLVGRFVATGRAVRRWALAHPHQYALIYGSPVPGYAAPEDTIGPATRVARVLSAILVDAERERRLDPGGEVPGPVLRDMNLLVTGLGAQVGAGAMARGLSAWIGLFGAVTFELFGHLHNVVHHHEAFFDGHLRHLADSMGIR